MIIQAETFITITSVTSVTSVTRTKTSSKCKEKLSYQARERASGHTSQELDFCLRGAVWIDDGHIVERVDVAECEHATQNVHEAGRARVETEVVALQPVLLRVRVALLQTTV